MAAKVLARRDADADAAGAVGDDHAGEGEEEDPFSHTGPGKGLRGAAREDRDGVEVRMLCWPAAAEFLCGSEMMLWSLLRGFKDHRMLVVKRGRGSQGMAEVLGIEMDRADLEGVQEDLMA